MGLGRLITSFILFFFLFFGGLVGVNKAEAATSDALTVGTHLLHFDPGAQLKVLQNLRGRGLPKGYPIVVNLDYSIIAEGTNTGVINQFADLAKQAADPQFAPIVRIVRISPNSDATKMANLAGFIQANIPNAPVELGNEINNQKTEWESDNYSRYGQLFDSLATLIDNPLGISTMDTSNSDFDAAQILPRILATINRKERITVVFANVYDLASCAYEAARCNLNSGEWILQRLSAAVGRNFTSEQLYITEFGKLDCPDYDCLQEFYETNADHAAKLKVGFGNRPGFALGPTTNFLHTVPGLCEYWELDSLNINRPSKCGASGGIYIYPGIDDQPSYQEQVKMAATYMMTCASPTTLAGDIENLGDIDKPSDPGYISYGLSCPGDNCLIPQVTATVFINHEQTTIPLFRFDKARVPNASSELRRLDDLEGYFGSSYQVPDSSKQDPLAYNGVGLVNKLTSENSQCFQTVEFLQSIKSTCEAPPAPITTVNTGPTDEPFQVPETDEEETEKKCALDLNVPEINRSYLDVLTEYNNLPGFQQTAVCGQIPPTLTGQALANVKEVRSKVLTIERTTPRAYKPAYIVRYINLPRDNPTIFERFQNWFRPGGETDEERMKNRIRISKVYVPAGFATLPSDSSNVLTSPSTSYTSPFMASMQALVPQSQQTEINRLKTAQIAQVEQLTNTVSTFPDNWFLPTDVNIGKHVNCPECSGDNLYTLFVKRINAEIEKDHLPGDDINYDCTLRDRGGEKANERKALINPSGNTDPVREIAMSATADLLAKGTASDGVEIRTYVFLPEEYRNVSQYEDALSEMFLTKETQLSFSETIIEDPKVDKNYRYLQLSDTAPKLGRSGYSVHVSSPTKEGAAVGRFIGNVFDPITRTQQSTSKDLNLVGSIVGDELDTFDVNPQVPGGKLARSLWSIMCGVVQPFASENRQVVTYQGFEKLLQRGMSACFTTDKTQRISTTLSSYFNGLKDLPSRYTTFSSPPKTCGYVFVEKGDAQQYASELPAFASALAKGLAARGRTESFVQSPLFQKCAGGNCAEFISNFATENPLCDGTKYLNPYFALILGMNEWSVSTIKPNGTGYYFGCQPFSFSKMDGDTYQNLQCKTELASPTGIPTVHPLLPSASVGSNMTQDVFDACVATNTANPLGQGLREDMTLEDGFACFIGRLQNFCEESVRLNKTADTWAIHGYGYDGTNGSDLSVTLQARYREYVQIAKEGGYTGEVSFNATCN